MVEQEVDVTLTFEEVTGYLGNSATLECDYTISSGQDLPVTVTWKQGDGPRYAEEIFTCTGYTKEDKSCVNAQVTKIEYLNRIQIANSSPSLVFTKIEAEDNHNYWCQVAIEGSNMGEEQVDMKSVVLRVRGGHESPKMHSVTIEANSVGVEGADIQLDCDCTGSHCDDVAWFKGPTNDQHTEYDMVYTRTSGSRPMPTQYVPYGDWKGRASLSGDSLVITGLKASDAGRYWCEMRNAAMYGIGEVATDAKSTVVEIISENDGNVFTCEGKADGLYSDPYQCNMYYECVMYVKYHRPCPTGTVFAPGHPLYACEHPANVPAPCGTLKNN
uniref:chitinase n=1 Tax=Ciona intestinalis TaxID=7719 RepID=E9MWV4_CIOIN|nr:VCBPC6 [Ciona intestinalis]